MREAILFCLVTLLGAPCYGEAVDAYLLIGQSNACGRSYAYEFSDESLAQPFEDNIHFAWRELSWANTTDIRGDLPLGALQPHSTTQYGESNVGPEITLGRRLSHLGNDVLLLSFVSGGTNIFNYLPEYHCLYQPMLTYIDEQVANMRALGYTKINWKGLFVVTGESDCNNHNWLVDERLLTIQQSLEEDLGVSSLPLTYSLLKDNLVDSPYHEYSQLNFGAGIINDEVSELASADPDIAVTVSNADLDTRYTAGVSITDGIHYSADAYAAIGNRLFEAYMDMNYLPGDANSDGFVDGLDAQALASNWLKSDATWTMGDFDEDHFVGPKDATILATNWRLCPGDANSDGYINELDSQILASNWLAGDATWEMGDFDGDGTVGPKDATIMAANWTIIPRLFGDANLDGFVNGLDAHILESNWLAGDATWEMGDFDGDGIVGPKDATIMAANWRLCPGDANSDGFINELDAQILESNWLAGDATWKMGDFDGDGIVGPKDATIMAANWSASPASSVPEPSMLVLLVCLGMYAVILVVLKNQVIIYMKQASIYFSLLISVAVNFSLYSSA